MEKKLKTKDRLRLWGIKHSTTKKERDAYIELPEIGPSKYNREVAKKTAVIGAVPGSVIGGLIGHSAGGKKGAAIGSVLGGLTGGATLGGLSYLGDSDGSRMGQKFNPMVSKHSRKVRDRYKVVNGKMTEEEYAQKHYSGEEYVTLYHVTGAENVPSILRQGLKKSMATKDPSTASMRTELPVEEIQGKVYLARSLDVLPMEAKKGKVILEIKVPMSEFRTWVDVGDPLRKHFKNKTDYTNHYLPILKRANPEWYARHGEPEIRRRVMKSWDRISPEHIMVVERDIPAKYISVYSPS